MAIKRRQGARRRIMLDTTVLLWLLDDSPDPPTTTPDEAKRRADFRRTSKDLYGEAMSGQIEIVISAMALAEAVGSETARQHEKKVLDFLRHNWVVKIPVSTRVARCARALRRGKPPIDLFAEDMVQVATAVEYDIPEFLTTDGAYASQAALAKAIRKQKKPIKQYDQKVSLKNGDLLRIWTPVERRQSKDAEEQRHKERAAKEAIAAAKQREALKAKQKAEEREKKDKAAGQPKLFTIPLEARRNA